MFVSHRACNAGYEKQFEESCVACPPGYYKEPEALADESSVQQSCKKCSGSCGVGKYMAKACLGWQNSVCETCRTRCNPGQYITAQCSWNADTQCAACATTCPVNTRISQVTCTGTTSNDVVLANCIPCLVLGDCPDGTYLTSKCTGETMMLNICGICSTYTCEAGSYITGCKGYDDSFCKPYTQCKPGEFLNLWGSFNDGVCEKCLDCSVYGVPVAKACSAFQNTVCGGDACSESKPCASTTNSVRYCEYVLNPGSPVCGLCPVSQRATVFYSIVPLYLMMINAHRRRDTNLMGSSAWNAQKARHAQGAGQCNVKDSAPQEFDPYATTPWAMYSVRSKCVT